MVRKESAGSLEAGRRGAVQLVWVKVGHAHQREHSAAARPASLSSLHQTFLLPAFPGSRLQVFKSGQAWSACDDKQLSGDLALWVCLSTFPSRLSWLCSHKE